MSCATTTLKFSSFVLNILCWVYGTLSVFACSYALVTFNGSAGIRRPCIIGIVLGSLLFLATILGCCGALRESMRLTWTYAIILVVLMFAQIAAILLQPVDFPLLATDIVSSAWDNEITQNGTMAAYESQYGCCGKNGPRDYEQSGLTIPDSCYRNGNSSLATDLYTEGCAAKLAQVFESSALVEEISDWSLVGVEGITIIATCILAISLKNMKRRMLYH